MPRHATRRPGRTMPRPLLGAIAIVAAVVVVAGAAARPAQAQIGGGLFGVPFPVGGVYVDPDGVLHARQVARDDRLLNLRKRHAGDADKHDVTYISLPQLFAQVRQEVEAGRPIPNDMRFLRGMVKLRYVFVYPEAGDLVIGGDAEPWDQRNTDRPIGLRTGRPLLRLDDLVVALRTLGPGSRARSFGCSIDLTQQQLNQMVEEGRKWGAIRRSQRNAMARGLAKAVGPQKVRFFGIEADTPAALVCIEADYVLKRLALGIIKSPVPQVQSALSMSNRNEGMYQRWWFEPKYDAILVSADGNAFEIRGQSLQVKAVGTMDRKAGADAEGTPSARKFAAQMTEHFGQLAAAIGPFADLANVVDMSLLAALVGRDRLHEKAGWDTSWLTRSDGYPLPRVAAPRLAETIVNYDPRSGAVRFAVGGVMVDVNDYLQPANRKPDEGDSLKNAGRRPEEGNWASSTLPDTGDDR